MGCFFGCFRVKDKPSVQLFSGAVPPKNRDHLVSRNQLAKLLYASEQLDADGSPVPSKGQKPTLGNLVHINSPSSGVSGDENDDERELKKEVKLLKSWGTLLSTPAELHKATKPVKRSTIADPDASPETYSSPAPSSGKVERGKKEGLVSTSPENLHEGSRKPQAHENLSFGTHASQRSERLNKAGVVDCHGEDQRLQQPKDVFVSSEVLIKDSKNNADTLLSNSFRHPVEADHGKKFVHFECTAKQSADQLEKRFGAAVIEDKESLRGAKMSPYPTPLKLTHEMQTPGTVYTHPQNCVNGKNPRIRSQYVHPVARPVENSTQWKALKVGVGSLMSYPEEFSPKDGVASPERMPGRYWIPVLESCGSSDDAVSGKVSDETVSVDSSLTDWLKPAYSKDPISRNATTNSNGSKTSDVDRPIIGLVAAHWNDEQMSVSPKCWDGNGIPNSTSKYKEDQKVSWHATPFEERLEKALSEEKFYPQRGYLFDVDENECDTAASRC
ncbi:protein JASON-like isoform X1 [Nymphaea colorata]|nr:protein JASON-like isoform X1 [Nymphaea colorata]